jgi:hypothetical protein
MVNIIFCTLSIVPVFIRNPYVFKTVYLLCQLNMRRKKTYSPLVLKITRASFRNVAVSKRGTMGTVQENRIKRSKCCLISCSFRKAGYLSQLYSLVSLSVFFVMNVGTGRPNRPKSLFPPSRPVNESPKISILKICSCVLYLCNLVVTFMI